MLDLGLSKELHWSRLVNGSGIGELENEIWETDWEMETGKSGMGTRE